LFKKINRVRIIREDTVYRPQNLPVASQPCQVEMATLSHGSMLK